MSSKSDTYKYPNDGTAIELDPNNNGNTIRKAFLIESMLNLLCIPLITHTDTVLSAILSDPTQITPAARFLARSLAGIFVGALTPALWAGLPNTKTAIESRRVVYITLGLGELALIPIFAFEAAKGGGKDACLTVKASLIGIANLAPLLIWRGYVLFVRPQMMGLYKEVKRD